MALAIRLPRRASRTDEEGRVTPFVNDARGRPTRMTQADGLPEERLTTIAWHATLNVPTEVAAP